VRRGWDRFVADVGGDPLRLLSLLACFALTGYAAYRASLGPLPERMAVWFVGAAVAHDLVLYPLYALADRSWSLLIRRGPRRVRAVPVVNYVRVPAMFSALLFLVFWGVISGQGDASFRYASDHSYVDYLARWLVVVGVLFGVSAVLYAIRTGRTFRGRPTPSGERV
jgi:hypothetical protein